MIAFSFKSIAVLLAFYCVYCYGVVVLTYAGNKARQEGGHFESEETYNVSDDSALDLPRVRSQKQA